jgi:hypothetical protein
MFKAFLPKALSFLNQVNLLRVSRSLRFLIKFEIDGYMVLRSVEVKLGRFIFFIGHSWYVYYNVVGFLNKF